MYQPEYDSDDAYLRYSSESGEEEDQEGPAQPTCVISHSTGGQGIEEAPHSFEQAMEDELDATMQGIIRSALGSATAAGSVKGHKTKPQGKSKKKRTQPGGSNAGTSDDGASASDYYDEIYFDSGSEEEAEERHCVADGASASFKLPARGTRSRRRQRVPVLTNEDLFYDPDIDEDNELWMANKLRSHRGVRPVKRKKSSSAQTATSQSTAGTSALDAGEMADDEDAHADHRASAPRSDAHLSCPACLVTLCVDCQRHEVYRNQYRAMFVVNCAVKQDQVLKYKPREAPRKPRSKKKKRAADQTDSSVNDTPDDATAFGESGPFMSAGSAAASAVPAEERYHPVLCGQCATEVAVYDHDEVYHFFNVIAGHA